MMCRCCIDRIMYGLSFVDLQGLSHCHILISLVLLLHVPVHQVFCAPQPCLLVLAHGGRVVGLDRGRLLINHVLYHFKLIIGR